MRSRKNYLKDVQARDRKRVIASYHPGRPAYDLRGYDGHDESDGAGG
jgi:hypothetical protein